MGMSASDLEKCRENLKHQWENRQVDEQLLQRAWKTVHRVATVLYQDYGASKVAVFGSLAEREWFYKNSDIDIVVWGIADHKLEEVSMNIKSNGNEFKIDLNIFKHVNGVIQNRIIEQGIKINNCVTNIQEFMNSISSVFQVTNHDYYEIIKNSFILRIKDENQKIQDTVNEITKAVKDIEGASTKCQLYIQKSIVNNLLNIYKSIEDIFRRIAREVDQCQPPGSEYPNDPAPIGSEWAYVLILQMAEKRSTRPAVISPQIASQLIQYLRFCSIYDDPKKHDCMYKKAEKHAKRVGKLFDNVSKELNAFTDYLRET